MPYARPYRWTSRMRRNRRRRAAASSIQAAWRRRKRRKAGSVVARTALANRRAIKRIKKNVELKYAEDAVCSARTNFCGQILSATQVDAMGMNQSSAAWVAAGGAATVLLPDSKYCPLILNPIVVPQAGNVITSGSPDTYPDNYSTREGSDIILSHFTAKFTMTGGVASSNNGNYLNVAQRQEIVGYLLLDRHPVEQNSTLHTNAPTFQELSMSCQLYPRTPDNVLTFPGDPLAHRFDYVRTGPLFNTSNPPGLGTSNDAQQSSEGISWWNKDLVRGKEGRFKVLKRFKLSCYQRQAPAGPNLNGSRTKTTDTYTLTYKGKLKFHFSDDQSQIALIPDNQTLLIALQSNCPTKRSSGGSVPVNFADPPRISMISRVNFKDP